VDWINLAQNGGDSVDELTDHWILKEALCKKRTGI
jgi:hypothetical protein